MEAQNQKDNIELDKGDWFQRHRMITIGIFLLIIWFTIFYMLWAKADEVTKDPCAVCSERMGEQVVCTIGEAIPVSRYYYPNGSLYEDKDKIKFVEEPLDYNVSELLNNLTEK